VIQVAGPTRVPVILEGWIRTTEHAFLVSGLRATLVHYVASAPGWPRIDAPLAIPQPDGASIVTQEGVPIWEPPAPVRAARARSGQSVRDVRSQLPAPEITGSSQP
jgi:hypothetical protein